MRIMWFCNTPSRASDFLGVSYGESWLKALQAYFENSNIELAIVFYIDRKLDPFELNGTKYFPLYQKKNGSKIKKNLNRAISSFKDQPDFDATQSLKFIADFNPDLLHIHGTENPFGLLAKYTKIPIVISIQGNLTVWSKFYFRDLDKLNLIKKTPFFHWLLFKDIFTLHKIFSLKAKVERNIFILNEYFIGRTDWDRRVSLALNPHRTYLNCGEILRESFYQNRWGFLAKETLVFTSVVRPGIYKGLETIAETALILENTFDLNFVWNVIGTAGDNSLLKVLGINKSTTNKVKFLGFKTETQIIEILLKSDLYVHPSHIENSPNAVGEAQLIGMPVIATYAGGTGSMVKDGETGILVQDGDPWHLAGAIVETATQPELMRRLGNNAHKAANARHSPQEIFHSTISIYKTIIDDASK